MLAFSLEAKFQFYHIITSEAEDFVDKKELSSLVGTLFERQSICKNLFFNCLNSISVGPLAVHNSANPFVNHHVILFEKFVTLALRHW